MPHDPRLTRIDDIRVRVHNAHDIDTTLFANADVPVEAAAGSELIDLLALQETARRFAEVAPDNFDRELELVGNGAITIARNYSHLHTKKDAMMEAARKAVG